MRTIEQEMDEQLMRTVTSVGERRKHSVKVSNDEHTISLKRL